MFLGLLMHHRHRSNLELPACMAVSCISPPEPSNEFLESVLLNLHNFTEPAQT